MKKKIIIAGLLMVGVLSLNSCVKDNESDAVKNQREAQTEKLKAEAAKELAEAEVKKAEAAVQNAEAELKKAQQQYLVELKKLEAEKEKIEVEKGKIELAEKQDQYDKDAAGKADKIQKNIEDAKADLIAAKAKAEIAAAEYEKTIKIQTEAAVFEAKVNAENNLAQSKKDRLDDLISKLGDYQTKFTKAVGDVVNTQNDLNDLSLQIAEAKAGVTSAENLYKKYVAGKKADIEKQKAIIEAYQGYVNTSNPDATYAKLEAAKVAAMAAGAAVSATSEEAVSAKKDFEGMKFESMLDLKAGESDSKLSFFEALDKLYETRTKTVKNVETLTADNVRADLEVEGTEDYDVSGTEKFTVKNLKTYTEEQLVSRFVDENYINFEIKKINAGLAGYQENVKTKKSDLKTYLDGGYKSAEDNYKTDPVMYGPAYQTAIEDRRNLEAEVKKAEKDLADARKDATELEKYRTQAKEGAKEVVAKIAEFKKAQEAVVAKAKVYDEKVKAKDVADAKQKAIEDILGDDTKPLTVEGAKAKIKAAEQQIATLEGQILEIDKAPKGAKDVIAQMEKDKQTLEFELEKAKQERDTYKKAYDQAVAALKAFQESQNS